MRKHLCRRLIYFSSQMRAGSKLVASLNEDSARRQTFIEKQVREKYNKMLHPPLTYLGDAFQYRTADGKFNVRSIIPTSTFDRLLTKSGIECVEPAPRAGWSAICKDCSI